MSSKPFRSSFSASLILFLLALAFMIHVLTPVEGWALGTYDMRGLFYPWWESLRNALFQGRVPWWDDRQLAGNPFLHNPQIAFFYPLTWFAVLFPINIGITLFSMLHLWLAGWGMYLFVCTFSEIDPPDDDIGSNIHLEWLRRLYAINLPALLAALTFMFSGFFAARLFVGHSGLIAVHVWLPWLLWGTDHALKKRSWGWAALTGIFFALSILAGHSTSVVYIGFAWAVFVFWNLFFERTDGNDGAWHTNGFVLFGGMGLLGILISAVQLVPTARLIQLSGRTGQGGFDFATDFSFPPAHLLTLFVPEFFGEPTRAGYWSVPNFEELAVYIGVLPILMLLLLPFRPSRRSWFFVILIIVGILLGLGRYGFLYRLLFNWFPPFRVMRAPGRAMFLYVFAGSALIGEVVFQLRRAIHDQAFRSRLSSITTWIALGALLGGVVTSAAVGAVFAAQHPTDTSGRLWHQLGGWVWAFGSLSILAWLLRSYLRLDKTPSEAAYADLLLQTRSDRSDLSQGIAIFKRSLPGIALFVVILVDLWTFGYKLLQVENMTPDIVWIEANQLIPDRDDWRILPWGLTIFEQNGASQVGVKSVFGYNTLETAALTDMTGAAADPRSKIYDVLSVGYVIANVSLNEYLEGDDPFELAYRGEQTRIYARPNRLSKTRMVPNYEVVEDKAAALGRLQAPDFDPLRTVILDAEPICAGSLDGSETVGTTELIRYDPGYWQIQTDTPISQMLVISEIAFPGWVVTIDGVPTEWQTAYTGLRAVCVPSGSHLVEWRFRPTDFLIGGLFSILGMLLAGFLLFRLNETTS